MKNPFFSLALIGIVALSQSGAALADPQDRENRARITLKVIETDAEGHTRTHKIGKRSKVLFSKTPKGTVRLAVDPAWGLTVLDRVEPDFQPGAWSIKGHLPQLVIAKLIEQSCDVECQSEYLSVQNKIAELKASTGFSDYFYAGAFEVSGPTMGYLDDSSEFELKYRLSEGTELVVRVDLRRWWR